MAILPFFNLLEFVEKLFSDFFSTNSKKSKKGIIGKSAYIIMRNLVVFHMKPVLSENVEK